MNTTRSIMHATSSALRRARHGVARHLASVGTGVLALGLSVTLILAVSGLWFTPVAPGARTPPTTTTSSVPETTAALDASPAQTVVTTLLADLHHETGYGASDPSFATTDPLLAGCAASTIPVAQVSRSLTLSSTSLLVVANVDVYGAGLGALVVANMVSSTSSCGGDYVQTTSPTGLDGFIASGTNVSGSSILDVTFRRGDVVVSLYAFPTSYQSATTATMALAVQLDAQLALELTSVCVNENAPVLASGRNPTQSNYRPYATTFVVTPPATLTRPNLNLLNVALPFVVPPPPVGSFVSAPTPPVVPTIALTTVVREPALDTVGPGCGWTFTAMVMPPVPSNTTPLRAQEAAALTELKSRWAQWPTTVTRYLEAEAVYLSDLVSYEATVATTTTSTTTTIATTTTTTTPTTTTTSATTTSTTIPPG